ncbi:Glucose receptor Git3 [Niveomyces insectorum RCEF 264]|uniref:Glucose receptor Git3 n=1 Tax=Niveomyces insectorum RCEF 264 TaxID=1081102 RepID=A0A162J974_9HYPO|nr:Glucose receptor Git3 [Niveomyces insectorum RCEF 264]
MEVAGQTMLPPESESLWTLPPVLQKGLTAVAVIAFISLFTSSALFCHLTYKLIKWWRRGSVASTATTPAAITAGGGDDGRGPLSPGFDLALGLAERHFHAHAADNEGDTASASPNLKGGLKSKRWMGTGGGSGRVRAREPRKRKPELNQFLVLLYNLLLADMHQAMAFILNAVWVSSDSILVNTGTCYAQGVFVSNGDLSASLFIGAIAIHTYSVTSRNYKPPQWVVTATCIGIWAFTYGMFFIGIAATKNGRDGGGFYVRAAAWCWINQKYETLRLVTHYLFIFITLALTSILYTLVFFSLRRRQKRQQEQCKQQLKLLHVQQQQQPQQQRQDGRPSHQSNKTSMDMRLVGVGATPSAATGSDEERADAAYRGEFVTDGAHYPAFLIYPIIYVICTLPLALGRIATMAGADVPLSYFCASGALITSNGWLDVLLWSSTRRSLVFGDVDEEELGFETFSFVRTPPNRRFGNIVWVEGGANRGAAHDRHSQNTSSNSSSSHTSTKNSSRSSSRSREYASGLIGEVLHGRVRGGDALRSVRDSVLRGPRGWRELVSNGANRLSGRGSTVASGAGSASLESLQHHHTDEPLPAHAGHGSRGSGGLAIQMDTETSVVVEIEDAPLRPQRSREPSTSLPKYDEKDMPYLPPIE